MSGADSSVAARSPGLRSGTGVADAAVIVAFVAALASFLLFIDRGLDITDEGLYLTAAKYPADVWASTTDFHLYVGWLYRLSGRTVVGLRVCGVVLLLASAGVAVRGVTAAYRVARGATVLSTSGVAGFLGLGALLYYTRGAPTPGYNLLTSVASYMVMGLLLVGLARDSDGSPTSMGRAVIYCGVGAMAGLALFVKFPAGIVLLTLALGAVLTWPHSSRGAKARAAAAILLGVCCWLVLHLAILSSPAEWWRRFHLGLELVRLSDRGYELSTLMYGYAYRLYEVVRWQVGAALWPALLFLLLALGGLRLRGRLPDGSVRKSVVPRVAMACALGFAAWRIVALGWYRGGHAFAFTFFAPYLAIALGTALVVMVLLAGTRGRSTWPDRLGPRAATAMLLGAVGFNIGPALGTNNAIDMNAMLTMVPLFAAILFMVEVGCHFALPRWLGKAVLVGVAVLAAVQVGSAVQSPGRQNAGILLQRERVALGEGRDYLRVDSATASFLRRASSALRSCGFQRGGDLIGLVAMPGLVYALGGRSPGASWYFSWGPGAKAYNERVLSLIDPVRLRRAFLLVMPGQRNGLPDLQRFGIALGRDRALCGQLAWPVTRDVVQVWSAGAGPK